MKHVLDQLNTPVRACMAFYAALAAADVTVLAHEEARDMWQGWAYVRLIENETARIAAMKRLANKQLAK